MIKEVVCNFLEKARVHIHAAAAIKAIRKYCNTDVPEDIDRELNCFEGFPNGKVCKGKYVAGLVRLYATGQLDGENVTFMADILQILQDNFKLESKWNSDFNGRPFKEIVNVFSPYVEEMVEREKEQLNSLIDICPKDYTIVSIPDFETASSYLKWTNWCICENEFSFRCNTNMGQSFYFCLKDGYQNYPKSAEDDMGKYGDEYDITMIAVSVYANRRPCSCTTRRNLPGNDFEKNTAVELTKLLGRNFYDVFKPFT